MKRRGVLFVNQKILPSGYERLRYVLTNKDQYFDTGVYANLDTYCKMSVGVDNLVPSATYVLGVRSSTFSQTVRNAYCVAFDISGSSRRIWYGIDTKGSNLITAVPYIEKQILTIEIKNTELYVNNIKSRDVTNPATFTTDNTLLYGAMWNYENSIFSPLTNRLYDVIQILGELEIDNGTNRYNFIPCKRISDNVVGFYDVINNTFIVNQGYGDAGYITWFGVRVNPTSGILPSGYTQKQYVESHGQEYIDISGFDFNNNVYAEFNAAALSGTLFGYYNDPYTAGYLLNLNNGNVFTGGVSSAATLALTAATDFELDINQADVKLNNVTQGSRVLPGGTITQTISLFARKTPDSHNNYASAKIYSFVISDAQGNVIYNFIPCVKDATSEIGFYDIVNNTFVTNMSGSGAFTTN